MKAWLSGVMINLLKRLRSARAQDARHHARPGSSAEEGEIFDWLAQQAGADPASSVEEQLVAVERRRELLAPLSPAERETVELHLLHDWDGVAVAAQLGISYNSVRQRLHRAMRHLREHWRGGAR